MVVTRSAEFSLSSLLRVLGTGSNGTVWLLDESSLTNDGHKETSAATGKIEACVSSTPPPPEPKASVELASGAFSSQIACHAASAQCYVPVFALAQARRRAVKISPKTACTSNEQRVLAGLEHPFIVPFLGACSDEFKSFLVLEAGAAGDLATVLYAQEQLLEERQVRLLVGCLASALAYVHAQKLMYRDLKPENVIVDGDGLVRLVDFGLTKDATERSYTLCGTAEYVSPEGIQLQGHGMETDWWSLGIVCYELLHGYTPFTEEGTLEDPIEIYRRITHPEVKVAYAPHLTPAASSFVKRLLRRKHTARLGSDGAHSVQAHAWFDGGEPSSSLTTTATTGESNGDGGAFGSGGTACSKEMPCSRFDWVALEARDPLAWVDVPSIRGMPPLRRRCSLDESSHACPGGDALPSGSTVAASPDMLARYAASNAATLGTGGDAQEAPHSPTTALVAVADAVANVPAAIAEESKRTDPASPGGSPASLRVTCESMMLGEGHTPLPLPSTPSLTSVALHAVATRPPAQGPLTPTAAQHPTVLQVALSSGVPTVHAPSTPAVDIPASPPLLPTAPTPPSAIGVSGHVPTSAVANVSGAQSYSAAACSRRGPYCHLNRGFFSMV